MNSTQHPHALLPVPATAPTVTIRDAKRHKMWPGALHERQVHDASGVIDTEDIGILFFLTLGGPDGEDITDIFHPDPRRCRQCGSRLARGELHTLEDCRESAYDRAQQNRED